MPKLAGKNTTTPNTDDTYLQSKSKKSTIHRYNADTLVLYFASTGYANNRLKEMHEAGVQLTPFQQGDQESTYFFSESDIHKVATILKPITNGANKSPVIKKKRELSEEERQILRERITKARQSKNKS